jgi:hypothetical protein
MTERAFGSDAAQRGFGGVAAHLGLGITRGAGDTSEAQDAPLDALARMRTTGPRSGSSASPPNTTAAPLNGVEPRGPERNLLRASFGIVLFVGWGIATTIWLASTVRAVRTGDAMPVVTAASALALLVLLAAMEGLEVSVIDRSHQLWGQRPASYLARWLAARQLFVALIVTAATLLANRSVIVIPGTSIQIVEGFELGLFDLVWTTLTVLWFAQIFPKHLGATNPDRYLGVFHGPLFPVVDLVRRVGISQPGEWTADFVEHRLDWPAPPHDLERLRPAGQLTLGTIWCALRKFHARGQQAVTPGTDRP